MKELDGEPNLNRRAALEDLLESAFVILRDRKDKTIKRSAAGPSAAAAAAAALSGSQPGVDAAISA